MANPYDDLIAAPGAAVPGSAANPYDEVIVDQRAQQQAQMRAAVTLAAGSNPQEIAAQRQLAKYVGFAPAVGEALPDEMKRLAAVKRVVDDTANAPVLRKAYTNEDFARIGRDDSGPLSGIERTFGGTIRDVGVTALKGAALLPQAFVGLADIPTFGYAGKVLESAGVRFNEAQKILDKSYSPAQQRANAAVEEVDGFVASLGTMLQNPSTIATTIGQSVPQMLGGAALGRAILASAPKIAPWLAAALGEGVLGAGSAAEQIRADTADGLLTLKQSSAALLSGAGTTLFGAAGGKLAQGRFADIDTVLVSRGADAATAKALKDGFVRAIVKAGISEGVFEEMPQSVQEQLWQNWATDKPLGQGVGKAAAMGLLAGATTGAAVQGARRALQRQAEVTGAEDSANNLKAQFDLAAQALLRERNPDEFRTLVQSMADNTEGAPTEIYVDAEVLNQLAPELLNQLPQSVRDALPDALAANDVVAISTGDVLTIAPGTPLEQVLIENARIGDPMAMSQKEAKDAGSKAQEFLAQEAERVIQQASDQQAMQASSDRVKQGVLDQLNTVGRFRKEVNEGYATWTAAFYTTLAGRTGMTPEQMAAKYPLRVVGQSGQGAVLNAGGKVGEITVEGYHFSMADRPTLTTAMYGTGLKGSARNEILNNPDQRLKQRLSFYFDKGTGIRPESGVGGRAHRVQLTGVYDADADPLKLKTGNARDLESKLLDLGYKGYANRMDGTQPGQVIMLGEQNFTPELLGAVSRIDTGQRVAPIETAAPQWQTQASGDPAMLQTKLERMQGMPGWANYDLRIEGNELQVREKGQETYAQQAKALQQEIEQVGGKVNDVLQVDQLISSEEIPTITLQDLVGLDIFPTIADRTGAAAVYSGIDSSRLDVAIPLLGGPMFPLRETNVEAGVVWANRGKGVTSQKAAKLKAGANYMMVLLGDADMHQSNSTVAAAVMGTLEAWQRDGRISPEQVDALGNLVREAPSADVVVKGYLENFPGFDDAAVMHAYMDGMSFNARKRVIELLASKEAMALGAPPMNLILDATREPSMAGHRWGDGVILLEVDQTNTQVELGTEGTTAHPDFPVGIRGRVVGKLNAPISWQVLWQDWLNANNGASPRRAFELAKPVVSVTQELIDRIGPINQNNIDSARQARLAADFAADNWRQTGVPVNKGGASPQEFVDAILTTSARPVLTEYSLDQVKQGAKDGSFKVFQLGADGRIFFGMKYGDPGYAADYGVDIPEIGQNEVALVSVVNNEQGARGIGAPAVVLKALQEGATVLDCFAVKNEKFTDGFLPEIYAAFGFEKVAEIPFAPKYYSEQKLADAVKFWKDTTPGFDPATNGYPPLVIMKWKGTDADRTDIINRYLRDGVAGVLARGASATVQADGDRIFAPTRAEGDPQGGATDPQRDPGNQGNSAGARVASRARSTIQGVAGLNDGELRNLGLTPVDRTAVQRALGIPFTDNAVLNQDAAAQPAAPETLAQGPRGTFSPKNLELALNENADLSTFLHETGHFFLEVMADLASQPGAPVDIATDMAALMKWFGVADLATWNALPLDGKRPYHERFAESFEQYLMEGKAPSVELQPLFRKFRAWMLNVYKSLKAFVDGRTGETQIQLSPEIRQVFDRMLASEAQIAEANEVAGLLPNEEADAEANERLTARSLRDLKWTVNARAREIKKLQAQAKEQRKEVEAEVTAEVDEMPVYLAMNARERALQAFAEDPVAVDAGLDSIATQYGYTSLDQMMREIENAQPKKDVIQGMTDQRMLEQYGDLIDQRAIEAAANEAVHNEARARSLATELRSQAEMLNPRTDTGRVNAQGSRITVNALVEAAKQFAANVVARTKIIDLKAKAWQHTAAERRAGKRWAEATAKGETQEAVKAKQDQMLNNAAAKAAIDAQAEMRKYLTFFKRVIKDNNEKVVEKGRDPDVVNAARAVLAAYGVAPKAGKTALEYLALVEKNDPAMFAALQPSVQGALNLAQPLDALTMDELRGLHEEIQAMWHLAKRSRQMEVDGNLLDIEDAEAELQDRMQEIGVPDTMPGDTGAVTPREELARKLQYAGSILRRVEQWSQGMGSAFTKLVFQPVKEAADRYRADRVVYRKRYQDLVDAVAPALTKGLIAAPELNYTFGEGHNGIGHAELLHAILHTGNGSNKRKLLLGRGWATENADGTLNTDRWDAFLKRAHDTGLLNKAHYDFAQGVWDLLEQTKPLAQKTHRDVFGRYFAEVTADSFDTPFGSYAGGYVPAQADPRIVQEADLRALATLENENMSFSFPSTNKGFTKSRVEYNRPLMLDLRTIGQHLDKVLLFSHMEPAVRDVNKLLSRKGVSYSLGRIDPTIYGGMLTPWLKRSATQVVETPEVADGGISRMMSAARSRAGMALMFANLSNTLQQITGFSVAAIKVKPASMMRATATFIAAPKQTAKAVADASTFMANRMENEIAAINDAMDAILLDPNLYEKSQAWTQKHAYFLQTAMANTMEPIIWTAAYNDAITRGDSDRDAVRHADSVIRTTQGSTLPEDVSRLETGRAWARLFTQFIGYFNMLANTNGTALLQVSREMGLKKGAGKALGIITLGMLAPIWVAEAIAHAMRGGPEDEDKDGYLDDWLMAVFGMGTIKGTFAMVPFLGQAAQLTVNKFNDNPADDKFSLSPAISLIESTVSAPFSVYKAIADDGNRQKAVRDVASAVSIVTGLPAFAIARPLGYLAGVEQGKVKPTDALDLARGLVSGTASPASK